MKHQTPLTQHSTAQHSTAQLNCNSRSRGASKSHKRNSLASEKEVGTSANAGPHYQKLYARVTHILGNRKGQPNRSAMKGPYLERTASLITVPSGSGKFFMFEATGWPPEGWCNATQSCRLILPKMVGSPPNGGRPVRQRRRGSEPQPSKNSYKLLTKTSGNKLMD